MTPRGVACRPWSRLFVSSISLAIAVLNRVPSITERAPSIVRCRSLAERVRGKLVSHDRRARLLVVDEETGATIVADELASDPLRQAPASHDRWRALGDGRYAVQHRDRQADRADEQT